MKEIELQKSPTFWWTVGDAAAAGRGGRNGGGVAGCNAGDGGG